MASNSVQVAVPLENETKAKIKEIASTPALPVALQLHLRAQRPTQNLIFETLKDFTKDLVKSSQFFYKPAGSQIEKKLQLRLEFLSNKDLNRCHLTLTDASLIASGNQVIVEKYIFFVPTNAFVANKNNVFVIHAVDAPLMDFKDYVMQVIENSGVIVHPVVTLDLDNNSSSSGSGTSIVDILNSAGGSNTIITDAPPPDVLGDFDVDSFMLNSTAQITVDANGDGIPDDQQPDTGGGNTLIQFSERARLNLFHKLVALQDSIREYSQADIIRLKNNPSTTACAQVRVKPTQYFTEDFMGTLATGAPSGSFSISLMPMKMKNLYDGPILLQRYRELKAQQSSGALTSSQLQEVNANIAALIVILGSEQPDGSFVGGQLQDESLQVEFNDPSNENDASTDDGDGDEPIATFIPVDDLDAYAVNFAVDYQQAIDEFVVSDFRICHNEQNHDVQCKINLLREAIWRDWQNRLGVSFPSNQVATVYSQDV